MRSIIAGMLAVVCLTGCVAVFGHRFAPLPPEPDKATVYIYRINNFAMSGMDARFYVDGKPAFDLNANGYSYVQLAPGRHRLSENWVRSLLDGPPSDFQKLIGLTLDLKPGETRYIRFEAQVSDKGRMMDFHWFMRELSPDAALAEIADKHFQEPVK